MSKQTKKHLGGCPVAYGTDIFGDRWTLLVIRDMILHGKKRYGDLLDAEEKIKAQTPEESCTLQTMIIK